jgi:PAS domain S-box-containing protein
VISRDRTLSVRGILVAIAIVGVVYVIGMTLEVTLLLRPRADALRSHARTLLAGHDAVQSHLAVIRGRVDSLRGAVGPQNGRVHPLSLEEADGLAMPVRTLLDSVTAVQVSLELTDVPPAMRVELARAAEQETEAALTLLDAIRALERADAPEARRLLRLADMLLDGTTTLLAAAQRVAILDVLEQESRLLDATGRISRLSLAWGGLGALLMAVAFWLVRRRLYGPLMALERAVDRVAGGDLTADAPVLHQDELGRLADHFNAMTVVLRQRAAEAERRQESLTERFGRILDESASEIYLFDASTLRFVQANRGARTNLGYSMEELAGLTPLDVLREISPDGFDSALAMLRRGEQQRLLLSASQARKNGTTYPVEISLQFSPGGDPPVFVAVVEDLTELSRVRELNERLRLFALTEHRLIGSGELDVSLRAITEMAADALAVDRTGVWHYSSDRLRALDLFDRRTRTHQAGEERADGRHLAYIEAVGEGDVIAVPDTREDPRTRDLAAPGAMPELGAHLALPVRAGGRLVAVVTHEHVGAPRRWSAEELAFAASIADFVALAMEAAERRRLENALSQAHKMESIGRLAGGVAHDFNNLLTAILGYLELMRMRMPAADPLRADLEEVEQAAQRATALTRQLLTFARRQVIEPRVVDVNALTQGADSLLRRLIGEDIELVTILEPPVAPVRVDPSQFEQVIVNLAVNARDAMPEGGRLTIETRTVVLDEHFVARHPDSAPGRYVELAVTDTGIGMDRETLSQLFEPFFTTKATGRGTGLGLAICYGIVRQAGGYIWAYSEPGRGTTFKIYLPRVEEALEPLPGTIDARQPSGGRETILLVEDESQIRELAARVLRGLGYTVITATNGEEAAGVARARLDDIDLLVTDVVLPLRGGRELASRLRERRPGLRVLYMSGYTQGILPERDLVEANSLFLAKPFPPSELSRRVRELLDRREEPAHRSPNQVRRPEPG